MHDCALHTSAIRSSQHSPNTVTRLSHFSTGHGVVGVNMVVTGCSSQHLQSSLFATVVYHCRGLNLCCVSSGVSEVIVFTNFLFRDLFIAIEPIAQSIYVSCKCKVSSNRNLSSWWTNIGSFLGCRHPSRDFNHIRLHPFLLPNSIFSAMGFQSGPEISGEFRARVSGCLGKMPGCPSRTPGCPSRLAAAWLAGCCCCCCRCSCCRWCNNRMPPEHKICGSNLSAILELHSWWRFHRPSNWDR